MIFRASKGNALTIIKDAEKLMKDSRSGEMTEKAVFIILYKSGTTDAMTKKLARICDSFGARRYEVP